MSANHAVLRTAIGRMGGNARAANMTPAARSASARKAIRDRWSRISAKRLLEYLCVLPGRVPEGPSSLYVLIFLLQNTRQVGGGGIGQEPLEQWSHRITITEIAAFARVRHSVAAQLVDELLALGFIDVKNAGDGLSYRVAIENWPNLPLLDEAEPEPERSANAV